MAETSLQWSALKAWVNEWPECFRSRCTLTDGTSRACLDEARQLQAQLVITQPMVLAVGTLVERMQAFFTDLARGVRWFVPPPEWLLVWEMDELRAAIAPPDLTEVACSAILEKYTSSVESLLSEMGILNDAPDLRVEFARLIFGLADG